MSTSLVLTVIGRDRPGLVESLSRTLAEHEASWLESRMANLAGRFAGVLRVRVSRARAEALAGALAALASETLSLTIERGESNAMPARRGARLTLLGADRRGIVHDVASALARAGANVEELESECLPAPMCGGGLFRAAIRLSLPRESCIEPLREALEALGDELIVEIAIDEPTPVALDP